MLKAPITEIFSSLQGEGPHAGEPQIFVRFHGCNLQCRFCDEKKDRYEDLNMTELFKRIDELVGTVPMRSGDSPYVISWTGGEPLLHSEYLKAAMKLAREKGFRNYLETNGTMVENLREVLDWVDVIAMDIKLPSMTGEAGLWEDHAEFLSVAAQAAEAFVKIVASDSADERELDRAVDFIEKIAPGSMIVLQPESTELEPLGSESCYRFLNNYCTKVRKEPLKLQVIPRLHKVLNIQ